MTVSSLITKAEEVLIAVRQNTSVDKHLDTLAKVDIKYLEDELSDDSHRLAFWINLYNAYYQIIRKRTGLKRPAIFTRRVIRLAGKSWSLDDIEHGILRRYRYKYSLGYLPNLFAPLRVKRLAVERLDFRIHFALNCGAVSCPPIAFYSVDKVSEQLNKATVNFLRGESIINKAKLEIWVSRILFWFIKDFGGMKGIRKLLEANLNINLEGYKIRFLEYSWEEQLDNFT